jgi:uncharacterized iron-regulated membrane protein
VVTLTRLAPDERGRREAAPAMPRKKKRARVWWHVHQWTGLKLSIFMSFILFTGTLAVFAHEIDWLLNPSLRIAPSTAPEEPNWPAIARTAAAYPDAAEVHYISAPIASAFAATASIEKRDGSSAFLDIHPATGELQGERSWVGAHRVLRNMHRHLNLPGWIGIPLVSSLAFLLLVSLVTSLVVYKKWWSGFFKPIRTRDARTGWGDFHRLAGAWSLWFVALMVVTGAWYFVESLGGDAPAFERPPELRSASPPPQAADGLARSLDSLRALHPGFRIETLHFPEGERDAFGFDGHHPGEALLVRPRANAVWTDASSGKILLSTDSRSLSAHQRISEAADPLHFGTWGGYWSKVPWFLFGLLLTALSVSGVALYAMRIAGTKHVKGQGRGLLAKAWQGMGYWRWLATAAVVAGFVMLPTLFQQ